MQTNRYIHSAEFRALPYSIRMAYIKGAMRYWMNNPIPFTLTDKV